MPKYDLVDMKRSAGSAGLAPMSIEYPYGLRITLCEEELDKLGIEELPAAGEEVEIHARGKVVVSRMEGGEESQSIEIQICELDVGLEGDEEDDEGESTEGRASRKLYREDEDEQREVED